MSKTPASFDMKFILASASKRRSELLSKAGYKCEGIPAGIDEQAFLKDGIAPTEFARQTALAKADKVAARHPETLVLAADTVVDCNGHIIGKARDKEHARQITQKLFSSPIYTSPLIALITRLWSSSVIAGYNGIVSACS